MRIRTSSTNLITRSRFSRTRGIVPTDSRSTSSSAFVTCSIAKWNVDASSSGSLATRDSATSSGVCGSALRLKSATELATTSTSFWLKLPLPNEKNSSTRSVSGSSSSESRPQLGIAGAHGFCSSDDLNWQRNSWIGELAAFRGIRSLSRWLTGSKRWRTEKSKFTTTISLSFSADRETTRIR